MQLPTGLYNRLKRRAEQAHHSVEAEVLETVAEAQPADGEISPDLLKAISRLAASSDATLWQAARARFPEEKPARLEALHLRRQQGDLSHVDAQQTATLADELERFMFLRAQAMSLLMQRGHDVSAFGQATVAALRLNRPLLVRSRQIWVAVGLHPPKIRTSCAVDERNNANV